MVGEMRDLATISATLTAAETGHLVLATLHTPSAPESVDRIVDVFPSDQQPQVRSQLSMTMGGVIAQRLVRRICTSCREEYTPEPVDIPSDFKIEPRQKLYRGAGCRECRHTGYRGRLGIFELLPVGDEIREMILQRKSATDIQDAARADGLKLMREDGWAKVVRGITTVEEVVRVTKVDAASLSR